MKIFLSYRFTGEDPKILAETNKKIAVALQKNGHQVFDTMDSQEFYQNNSYGAKEIIQHSFGLLDQADAILAYIANENRSEGMLMELGYALAKGKKIIVAVKKDVNTYAPKLADQTIEFENLEDLYQKLEQVK